MKKIMLGIAFASLALSCQKIQPGGNKGVLVREEGTERYSDDVMTDKPMPEKAAGENQISGMINVSDSAATVSPVKGDSTKTATVPVKK